MAEREQDVVRKSLSEIRNNNIFGINIPMLPDSQLPIHRPDLLKLKNPEDYPLNASGQRTDSEGKRYIRIKGVRWFTNLDYKERH